MRKNKAATPALHLGFTLACCYLLSGCGFRLYGADASFAHLADLQLSAGEDADRPLLISLQHLLADRGIKPADSADEKAMYRLRITGSNYVPKPVSFVEGATIIEYRATLSARIKLTDSEGRLLHEKTLSASRLYTRVVASPSAEYQKSTEVQASLRQALAERILLEVEQALSQ